MSTGKVVLGALAGLALGAALGILFAPEKGKTTRRKISKKSRDFAEDMTDKFNELIDTLSHKFEGAKDEVKMKMEDGKARAERAYENATNSQK